MKNSRADVWAFGAVLYQMLTGRKAFQGKNYSSLVGAILSTDPAPVAPAWLERIVRRCLQEGPRGSLPVHPRCAVGTCAQSLLPPEHPAFGTVAISPDGRLLAFHLRAANNSSFVPCIR